MLLTTLITGVLKATCAGIVSAALMTCTCEYTVGTCTDPGTGAGYIYIDNGAAADPVYNYISYHGMAAEDLKHSIITYRIYAEGVEHEDNEIMILDYVPATGSWYVR